MKRLHINPVPCTGCLNCVMVCRQRRAGDSDPGAGAIQVLLQPFSGEHEIVVCHQCRRASCAEHCPQGAIYLDPELMAWRIDRSRCVRCAACVAHCPFGAMRWWSDDRGPVKCELCDGEPQCARACHFGVIIDAAKGDTPATVHGMLAEDLDQTLGRG